MLPTWCLWVLFLILGKLYFTCCFNRMAVYSLFMFGLRLPPQQMLLKPMVFQRYCFSAHPGLGASRRNILFSACGFSLYMSIIFSSVEPNKCIPGASSVDPWCILGASLHPSTWSQGPLWTPENVDASHQNLQRPPPPPSQSHPGADKGALQAFFFANFRPRTLQM